MSGAPASRESELSWRAGILRHFSSELADAFPLTVVRDPDGLFADAGIQAELSTSGFMTWLYEDSLRFRLAYETRFREPLDAGEDVESLVILHRGKSLQELPFDVLAKARALRREFEFTLADMFPGLAPAALEDVDPTWLDDLHHALAADPTTEAHGTARSRDLILSTVFDLDVKKLHDAASLVEALCQLHLQRKCIPTRLVAHLASQLKDVKRRTNWPLPALIQDRAHFLGFLQKQWSDLVAGLSSSDGVRVVRERNARFGGQDSVPTPVPFDDPSVAACTAALFLEGQLQPVVWEGAREELPASLRWGLSEPEPPPPDDRILALVDELKAIVPTSQATHREWLSFAQRWAELVAARYETYDLKEDSQGAFETLWMTVDTSFSSWMEHKFRGLELTPGPVMLHRVLENMARRRAAEPSSKSALLVMDGMAWPQWVTLRESVWERSRWSVSEEAVFAWVPTITPVSRQALFAARPPREFAESIHTTLKDKTHWVQYWTEIGIGAPAIQFLPPAQGESTDAALARVREAAEHPKCEVLAMTSTVIDELAHAATDGASGLHAGVRHFARSGWLRPAVDLLLDEGFEVWITSDHGNLECVGTGRPNEGALVGERGARVRVFEDEDVRNMIAEEFSNAVRWPAIGLPADYLPLLSEGRTAFASDGKVMVSHGATSLEEVIVPLVRITARES